MGPWFCGCGGVFLSYLVAVSEHFGHERSKDFGDQAAEGCVACAQQVDSVFSEPFHERVGVDVLLPGLTIVVSRDLGTDNCGGTPCGQLVSSNLSVHA